MTCQLLALRIDASGPIRLARFWAGVLDQELAGDPDGCVALQPRDDTGFRLRFVPARAQKAGQNHWHFHLTSTSLADQQQTVARLLGLGARHIDIGQRPEEGHIVLADPEGNEFCVMEPGNNYLAGCGFLAEVTCAGSRKAGFFWSEALGWPLVWDEGLQTAIQSPQGGPKVSWDEERLPPETRKGRLYFDLVPPVDGDQQAEVGRMVSLGATRTGTGAGTGAGAGTGTGEASGVAMADPDGREFCVLPPR